MPYAHAIHCEHDPLLMLLSYAIAVLGSLTALQMALALPPAGWARMRALFWAGGALGVGGIWAMHFIAMLGCRMPLPVSYDIGVTALSAVIAWLSCWAGLAIAGSRRLSRLRLLPAGLLAGVGVAGMHYTGMAAMRMPATLHYDAGLVILSVAIAIVASWIALWLTFHHDGGARMAFGALVMGVAVSGLHYTGMAAASFVPTPVDAVVPMGLTPPRLGMVIFALTALALLIALLWSVARSRQRPRRPA